MKKTTNGFTLIELLIVIAIVGILAGLVSSAIVVVMKSATEKRIASNGERLKAAIVEYWHDMGRWPIPENAEPVLETSGRKRKDVLSTSTDPSAYETTYSYVLSFSGNNDEIVSRLIDALLPDNQTQKTFVDLHGYTVPVPGFNGKWPAFEVVDAYEAHEADPSTPLILCYFADFVYCRHCKRYYLRNGATGCSYDGNSDGKPDCTYYEENNLAYKFTDDDFQHCAMRGALPYVIWFDLNNNVVDVRSDPGAFKFQQ